jgi:pyrroloquinoline quinone biosynthesis protein B
MLKIIKQMLCLFGFILLNSCFENDPGKQMEMETTVTTKAVTETSLIILGTMQDAGSPQIGCTKDCCRELFSSPGKSNRVVALGLVDMQDQKKYLFEATPDITQQAKALKNFTTFSNSEIPDGIFVTHAHIGHYTGLQYLGKEAMNTDSMPVYAMPRLQKFLEENGPWSQLVKNNNIAIREMQHQNEIKLSAQVKVMPFTVPHRDEYSETVGFIISGPNKKALFIPDIDKWEKWETGIIAAIEKVDYALIDGTFFDAAEINNPQDPVGRDISAIPHPFIIESMDLFKALPASEKKKIYFIHFNHTNAAIKPNSNQAATIKKNGFNIALINQVLKL